MLIPLSHLRDGLMRLGISPADRPDERVRKQALVLTAVAIAILATFWTATYLVLGRPLSAAIPFAYQVVTVVGLTHFARTRSYGLFRAAQIGSMLVLPFLLQWTLGGFVNSGAVMVWAFAAPIAALVLSSPRRAVTVFAGYVALTIVSGLLDPALAANSVPLPEELRLLFFVLDIGFVSFVAYTVLQYFVTQRERAQQESDLLLHNILPVKIADRLKSGEGRIADDHAAVTVLFADIAGFTPLARRAGADEVVRILDRLFTGFDGLAERFGLEKIKTIGDSYMAVAGAPEPRPDHAKAAADMALEMLLEAKRCSADVGHDLAVRIGIHSGPVMAGVIGRRKFIYDVWGDAVNVASRMESQGVPGKIQVSEAVESELRGSYRFEPRGTLDVKGLGEMGTFFLLGRATMSN